MTGEIEDTIDGIDAQREKLGNALKAVKRVKNRRKLLISTFEPNDDYKSNTNVDRRGVYGKINITIYLYMNRVPDRIRDELSLGEWDFVEIKTGSQKFNYRAKFVREISVDN